jgi:transposase-like protein
MSTMLRRSTDLPQRKVIARASLPGETDRKRFAASFRLAVDRAIALSGLTKQQFAGLMGYADASALSRWISGAEPVNVDRLWSTEAIHPFLITALAEQAGHAVEIETTVRLRRRVG